MEASEQIHSLHHLSAQVSSCGELAMQASLAPTSGIPQLVPAAATTSKPEITVLSFGAGQDSTAILYLLVFNAMFRTIYAPGKLIVIFSDTMDEHPATYAHLNDVRTFCSDNGIPFFHLLPRDGYHAWDGLREQYRKNSTVGSKAFQKSCTDALKIQPIYNFLEEHIGREYNFPTGRKQGLVQFSKKYGKIHVLIGIAKGEERRIADPSKIKDKWKRESVRMIYPLVDLGMDRGDCQRYIRAVGKPVPLPSNCRLCPWMSEIELLYLFRFMEADYRDWVEIERNKLERFKDKGEKNYGVWGKRTLPEVLAGAIEKYGHFTDEQLHEKKMNHGHCVASKY